jgi:hypothetical protein
MGRPGTQASSLSRWRHQDPMPKLLNDEQRTMPETESFIDDGRLTTVRWAIAASSVSPEHHHPSEDRPQDA